MRPVFVHPEGTDSPGPVGNPPRRKVLFVWDGLTSVGGVETFLYQCLRFMPSAGIQPYILDVGTAVGAQAGQFRDFAPFILRAPELVDSSRSIWDTSIGCTLADLKIDAVVLNEWTYGRILFDISAEVPGIAICHTDSDDLEYYPSARLYCPRLNRIVGVSATICEKLKAHLPLWKRRKVVRISYGVEVPASEPTTTSDVDGLRLIYIGRVRQEQKRILDFVEFVRALNDRRVRSTLTIVGDGTEMTELRRRLSELHGPTTVRILGARLHLDTLAELSKQDIFVLFSEHEGLPISGLEALVRGVVPVVSSVKSGILEILTKGENAELFPIGRPDIAARIVDELSVDRSGLARLREGARRLGSMYRIEEMIRRHVELIDG